MGLPNFPDSSPVPLLQHLFPSDPALPALCVALCMFVGADAQRSVSVCVLCMWSGTAE